MSDQPTNGEYQTLVEGNENDAEALRSALLGRSVVALRMGSERRGRYGDTAEGEVHLDDGSVLLLAGNIGGCSCGAGDYELTALNDMPVNGIMNVLVESEDLPEKGYEAGSIYRIFVIAQDERIRLAEFEGDDGNGYYGTGFWFAVQAPSVDRSPG